MHSTQLIRRRMEILNEQTSPIPTPHKGSGPASAAGQDEASKERSKKSETTQMIPEGESLGTYAPTETDHRGRGAPTAD
jgi:hypothetical protein